MGQGASGNIILTGFSTTGKSRVGREVARRLGWNFIDTDDEIVALAGKSIPEIFAQDGEARFREVERQVLGGACQGGGMVIASGGGSVLDAGNRELMARSGVVICLEARPQTIYQRLREDVEGGANPVVRPLLSGSDPLGRIRSLKEFRQLFYDMADWTVHTDELTVEEVVEEVIRGFHYGNRRLSQGKAGVSPLSSTSTAHEADAPYCQESDAACVVRTSTETYPVYVDWGLLPELGQKMRHSGLSGRANVISDEGVFSVCGAPALEALKEAGFAVDSFVVAPGERSKSLDTAEGIYNWLVERRVERGHAIVALGGGVVGDLAGFVAATFLRGVPLVQVPTSLIAMVDAAIGGKVAVNHPQAKNLIGAFYQPRLVLTDVQCLTTLPPRELTSGWAEVIKHALILDPELFQLLKREAERLLRLERDVAVEVVKRSAALKAEVVSQDERETGLRTILNYGHTLGHALEAAADYQGFLHGEAVAIGMMGAALISQRLGMLSEESVKEQRALLQRFGLPVTFPRIDSESLFGAMELDKKVRGKSIRWVLLKEIGETIIRDDVPLEIVKEVVEGLIAER